MMIEVETGVYINTDDADVKEKYNQCRRIRLHNLTIKIKKAR